MDGLSGAASGIAVVSLTFQIVESISKLHDFFESMTSAPGDVKLITEDLRQLSSILNAIGLDEKIYKEVEITCVEKIEKLNSIAEELEPGFQSSSKRQRRWTAFRTARKVSVLKKLRETLEETKTTLILALQTKALTYSQSNASHMTQIKQQICDETARKRDIVELSNRHERLSDQLADLSLQVKARVVSTETEAANLSNHSTQIDKEITHMTAMFQNPMIRKTLETAIKAAVESNLQATLNQQPASWQAVSATFEESKEKSYTLDDNNSRSRKRSVSPNVDKRGPKRRRLRHASLSTTSVKDIFFGRIYLQTDTYHVTTGPYSSHNSSFSNGVLERETTLIYHPAQWLIRGGVTFGVNVLFMRAAQGLTHQIRTFRTVPDDSLIFEFCREGNLDGIRSLLRRKEASPWDVNSKGWTPLYIASNWCHVEVCKLLLGEGADPTARTYRLYPSPYDRPLSAFAAACENFAWTLPRPEVDKTRQIDTLRLLLPHVEIADEHDRGKASCLEQLVLRASVRPYSGFDEVLWWLVENCRSEMQDEDSRLMLACVYLVASQWANVSVLKCLTTILDRAADVTVEYKTFSLLHHLLAFGRGGSDAILEPLRHLVEIGAQLHHEAYGIAPTLAISCIAGLQTPTTIAMRRSASFFCWRLVLVEKGQCLHSFVTRELQTSPLVSRGWTEETLLALFHYKFEPDMREYYGLDCRCCGYSILSRREIPWEGKLEMIRQGRILELQELDDEATDELSSEDQRMKRYFASSGDGRRRPPDMSNAEAASPEQDNEVSDPGDDEVSDPGDDEASDPGDDESAANEAASLPSNWPWQTICDQCEMQFGAALKEEGWEADDEDVEQKHEDFDPKMPGSFYA